MTAAKALAEAAAKAKAEAEAAAKAAADAKELVIATLKKPVTDAVKEQVAAEAKAKADEALVLAKKAADAAAKSEEADAKALKVIKKLKENVASKKGIITEEPSLKAPVKPTNCKPLTFETCEIKSDCKWHGIEGCQKR